MKKISVTGIRKRIDEIDKRILELLTNRAVFAKKIGQFKTAHGEEFYLPHREKNIITKIVADNPGPLSDEAIENIYREILHSCRSLQVRLKVAYLGPEATFTHLAAMKNFGKYTDYMTARTISDVFREVEKGRADYGVIPIENSTEGVVNHTLNMFIESDIRICAELYGLNIIAKNIEDLKENYTRFLVIGQKFAQKSGHDKTSIMFSVKDRVGALHDMLVPFKTYNINLIKIESRSAPTPAPTEKKAWEYIFFVDFKGHIEDKTVQKGLKKLEEQCIFMKVLGSYPQAE